MNIKEVEARSGLTRANIRFYEKEGLFTPIRQENGYRDYSEADLAFLKKIRLMRELGISLEQIKRLKENPDSLSQLMEQRLQEADREVMNLNDTMTVCAEIHYDKVSFQNMDTEQYLERLEQLEKERNSGQHTDRYGEEEGILPQDTEPYIPHPWKRFLARMLDLEIYDLLVALIWNGIFNQLLANGRIESIIMRFVALGLMFILEPLFVSCFGTTPGKWVFGISVYKSDGRRLTYSEAFSRTWLVGRYGLGFRIPLYSLYRLYVSRKTYMRGTLYWDRQDTEYQIKDRQSWKIVISFAVIALIIGAGNYGIAQYQLMPVNRGKLTVAEFAENYNRYGRQLAILNGDSAKDWIGMLNENGQYGQSSGETEIVMSVIQEEPIVWNYQEENGEITRISFEKKLRTSGYITGYQSEMVYAILAYVGAQDEITFWNRGMNSLLKQIKDEKLAFTSYDFTEAGIHVSCQVKYEEDLWMPQVEGLGVIAPLDDKAEDYSIQFVMEKVE